MDKTDAVTVTAWNVRRAQVYQREEIVGENLYIVYGREFAA